MRPRPQNLARFVRGLVDDHSNQDLLLPALWLIRHSGIGAILKDYKPDEGAVEKVIDRLFTEDRQLYVFVQNRMEEN